MPPRKTLDIDLSELAFALTDAPEELPHYLDLETGRIVFDAGETEPDLALDVEDPRYLPIPRLESEVAFRIMEAFAARVEDPALFERLDEALSRPKPFRRFTAVVEDDPDTREAWFRFKNAEERRLAVEFLHDHDLESRSEEGSA